MVKQITRTLQVPWNQTALFGPKLDHSPLSDHHRQERKFTLCPCTFIPLLVPLEVALALIMSGPKEEEEEEDLVTPSTMIGVD